MPGLIKKFYVTRTDGRDLPGGDREGTRYFVLDPANDDFAKQALGEYAYLCRASEPSLSADLYKWLEELDG